MARVTVLMPVYNASRFLREAIASILEQSFIHFEFIIIDDGSTDNSVEIIKGFLDSRIRLIQNEKNLGISETLNRGIDLARSELIARMDADDISHPERLRHQYEYMQAHPECGLLSSWARVVEHDRTLVHIERYPRHYYFYNLNFECWMYHPTVMYRKSVVKKVGGYIKPYSEDYDLFWRISREFVIDNLEAALIEYRLSPTSLNTVLRKKEYEAANRENVIRNLRHYMGPDFEIREEYLECLRHNFGPILALKDVDEFVGCLRLLDRISRAIMREKNVNRNRKHISQAAWHKKDFIAMHIFQHLEGFDKYKFAIKAGKPDIIYRKLQKGIRWRINSVKEYLNLGEKH